LLGQASISGIGQSLQVNCQIGDVEYAEELAQVTKIGDETYATMAIVALDCLISGLPDYELMAIGHRVVHGGLQFDGPVLANTETINQLTQLIPLAPIHQEHNLDIVKAAQHMWPDTPQILSFDTAFHRTQPRIASFYALPQSLTERGIVRFGFHGLSYTYISTSLEDIFPDHAHNRVVVAHLGAGASLCALQDGHSVATSMGLTTLDGVPMATRCGELDPGVVLHLIQEQGMTAEQVSDLLYHKSGLLGLSGLSGDVQVLLASKLPGAAEALSIYAYRIAREIGSMAVALGGIDALVFTGGVGEHAESIRANICQYLTWLGLELNGEANLKSLSQISHSTSVISVAVITANEELIIAQEAMKVSETLDNF